MTDLPSWLTIAIQELGVQEYSDPSENPRIVEYQSTVGVTADDEIPWCSAFVNWVLSGAGLQGTGSAAARSFRKWGKPTVSRLGAIAVLWRGSLSSWQGHVGFMLDHDDLNVYLVGGNQRNRVSVAAYPVARVLTLRWPT